MSQVAYEKDLDPDTKTTLKMFLFDEVKNVDIVRNNIMKGLWNCTVINPKLILDPFQVVVAANKAVVSEKYSSMVTKSVNTEILYNLSISTSINQSIKTFGIDKGGAFLICFLTKDGKDSSSEILPQIDGRERPVTDLSLLSSTKDAKKAYKLTDFSNESELVDTIVSRIVTKNFVSH